jgi:hypothetical protein
LLTGLGTFPLPFSTFALAALVVVAEAFSAGFEKNILLFKFTTDSSFLTFLTSSGGFTSFLSLLFAKKFSFPVPLVFSFPLSDVDTKEDVRFTLISVFTGSVFIVAGSGSGGGFDFEGPATQGGLRRHW